MAAIILDILSELGFDGYLAKKSPHTNISEASFEKLEPQQYRLIYYFLFCKYRPKRAQSYFQSVYPSKDSKQESEFKQLAFKWLEEIEPSAQLGKLIMIHFHRLSGSAFIKITAKFAMFVLSQRCNLPDEIKVDFIESSCKDAQHALFEYKQKNGLFETTLSNYEPRVHAKNEEVTKQVTEVEQQLARIETYGRMDLFVRANQKLESNLKQVNRYLSPIVSVLQQMKQPQGSGISRPLSRTGNLSGASNKSLSEPGQARMMISQMQQFEKMVKLFKEKPEIVTVLKDANAIKQTLGTSKLKLTQSQQIVLQLRETVARLKGQAFETEKGRAARQLVMDYFSDFLNTPLNFAAYGLDEKWLNSQSSEEFFTGDGLDARQIN